MRIKQGSVNFQIGDFIIGSERTFVIAEIGNNHNGSIERAFELIDLAIRMGADCVKFQMRHLSELYRKNSLERNGEDLGTEYVIDLLERFELSIDEHRKVAEYARKNEILYLCTPWDSKSVEVLKCLQVPAYKVASADLTNLPLLDLLCETGKPLIISTGMSYPSEVETTVDFLNKRNSKFALLHCNSTYPAPFHDIQLKWIHQLQKIHPIIGYSGHERGTAVSLAAVALGASIIERHFTLDRNMEGPDHAASLEHAEFKNLIEGIRQIEEALGEDTPRDLSQGEMINRENLGKSLIAASTLSKGAVLKAEQIIVRSPGKGLSPQYFDQLTGLTLQRDIEEGDFFYPSDLKNNRVEPRNYQFERPWGIPVRYHDFNQYYNRIDPDFFEFHFSYSDMDINPSEFLNGPYSCGFIIHAPELFSGSHLMDLAASDDNYRSYSLKETQRIIDITRDLKKYFPSTECPLIVANIGGFTMDAPLPSDQILDCYQRFAESLLELDLEGVELIPQTMAPFPWHFGGQRFQNLFVKIEEIIEWCARLGLRMCFDVSHSFLTCNHLGLDFYEFSRKMAPITAHLHMGDAKGLNGEGLQIGDGKIDFNKLDIILKEGCPTAPFIPEIWQGHKNNGEGFWIALKRLEGSL